MGWFSSACSLVGSVVSGIGSAISSGISAVCSAIGGTALGGLLSTAVTGFATALGVIGSALGLTSLQVVIVAVIVVSKIAEALGLKKENEDEPDELAMKAENADKKPEDFDSTEEYINYLHEKVTLDKEQQEKLKNMAPEERAAYQLAGSYLYLKASAEKLGLDDTTIKDSKDIKGFDPQFIIDVYKLGLSGEEIVSYIKGLQSQGINATKGMSDYLHNKAESLESANKVQEAIVSVIKNSNPSISEDDIDAKLKEMRDRV